jgi:hypothetical protein
LDRLAAVQMEVGSFELIEAVVSHSSMWSMAGRTVRMLGVKREKNKVASFNIYGMICKLSHGLLISAHHQQRRQLFHNLPLTIVELVLPKAKVFVTGKSVNRLSIVDCKL